MVPVEFEQDWSIVKATVIFDNMAEEGHCCFTQIFLILLLRRKNILAKGDQHLQGY